MEPFNGRCEMPEQKVGHGVITIGTKRLGHSSGAGGGKEGVDNNGAQGILQFAFVPPPLFSKNVKA